jgi:hypothetical protein
LLRARFEDGLNASTSCVSNEQLDGIRADINYGSMFRLHRGELLRRRLFFIGGKSGACTDQAGHSALYPNRNATTLRGRHAKATNELLNLDLLKNRLAKCDFPFEAP